MKIIQEQYYTELRKLIEIGYEIFHEYQLDQSNHLDACLCGGCTIEEDHDYLIHTPRKNIEITIFKRYVNVAYSDGKTPLNEFKYFLPLFLDFMVQGNTSWLSEDYFFKRVNSYSKKDWTQQELEFLQRFAESYLNYHLCDEGNVEFQPIERFLEMFQSYLFDTESLAKLCLNHPSAYCLIDYATQTVNHGYDEYEQEDEFDLTTERVRQILVNWKYSPNIKQHFIKKYQEFKRLGYLFNDGNAQWVNTWISQIEEF